MSAWDALSRNGSEEIFSAKSALSSGQRGHPFSPFEIKMPVGFAKKNCFWGANKRSLRGFLRKWQNDLFRWISWTAKVFGSDEFQKFRLIVRSERDCLCASRQFCI